MNKSSLPQSAGRVSQRPPQASAVQNNGQPVLAAAVNILSSTSFNQLTTLRWSLTEEVTELKKCNFAAIGLWRPKIAEIGEELAAEVIGEAGLAVSSLSFVGGFTGTNGLSFDDAVADARDAIKDAELLGAQNVIVVSGPRNGHTVRHSRRLLADALDELADFAGVRGVRLCVLPMHQYFSKAWTFLNTLDETLDVLNDCNHAALGLAFDTYQSWQEPNLIERIPEFAAMTGIVQISDAHRSPHSPAERCIPGEGVIPLPDIIRAFQTGGFDGYYDVQVWSSVDWADVQTTTVSNCHEAIRRVAGHPVPTTRQRLS